MSIGKKRKRAKAIKGERGITVKLKKKKKRKP
jgi:hypothetical protein